LCTGCSGKENSYWIESSNILQGTSQLHLGRLLLAPLNMIILQDYAESVLWSSNHILWILLRA
jgi:hypothetical protein